jgi:hypothetical protein
MDNIRNGGCGLEVYMTAPLLGRWFSLLED